MAAFDAFQPDFDVFRRFDQPVYFALGGRGDPDLYARMAARLDLPNGLLVHRQAATDGADVVVRTTRAALPLLLAGRTDGAAIDGDAGVLLRLTSLLEAPDPGFEIVTP